VFVVTLVSYFELRKAKTNSACNSTVTALAGVVSRSGNMQWFGGFQFRRVRSRRFRDNIRRRRRNWTTANHVAEHPSRQSSRCN